MQFPISLLTLLCLASFCHCQFDDQDDDDETYDSYVMTFILPAQYTECFYHKFNKSQSIYFEFQVISGGEVDIDFTLEAPGGEILEHFRKTGEESVTVDDTEDGEYAFCFDNMFSRYTAKTVFFELLHEGLPFEKSKRAPTTENLQMAEETFARMNVVQGSLDKIWLSMSKVSYAQSMFRAYEARDRWMLQFKFSRINFWSTVNIVVMLCVFFLQVYTVKRMLTVTTKK